MANFRLDWSKQISVIPLHMHQGNFSILVFLKNIVIYGESPINSMIRPETQHSKEWKFFCKCLTFTQLLPGKEANDCCFHSVMFKPCQLVFLPWPQLIGPSICTTDIDSCVLVRHKGVQGTRDCFMKGYFPLECSVMDSDKQTWCDASTLGICMCGALYAFQNGTEARRQSRGNWNSGSGGQGSSLSKLQVWRTGYSQKGFSVVIKG